MLKLNTNNYYIEYNNLIYEYKKYCNNFIISEIYRNTLYIKFKNHIIKCRKKIINAQINIDIDNNNFISQVYLYDIVSLLIINHKFESSFDPIFDSKSPFTLNNINNYLNKNCIPTLNKNIIQSLKNILPNLNHKYIKYYKKFKKKIKFLNYIKYNTSYEFINNYVIININILESKNEKINIIINNLKYNKKIKISLHIFQHLIKLYNTKVHNNYESNEIIDNKVIEYIYMVFIRYKLLSSGNNQSSILPSFKKIIKDKLNIKIELFGSPLNTSSFMFGSIFYDIDHVFGSIGNYFNTKIHKGYYQINPIFDKCLIDKIIYKCYNELLMADETKNPLLFLMILPISYKKFSNKLNILDKFKKFEIILNKINFPYIRYDRKFLKTKVSPIVDTHIIIYHNNYINKIIKFNVIKFNNILSEWQSKKFK
jgi:hypothetical protein